MSTRRHQRAREAFPSRGKGICAVCSEPIPGVRRRYCSNACAGLAALVCSPSTQRWRVQKRDRGVCALCGCDTEMLRRIAVAARDLLKSWREPSGPRWYWMLTTIIDYPRTVGHDLWQMDHITPVAEGGGIPTRPTVEGIMSNLRTLCLPCHNAETGVLRRRLNLQRKEGRNLFTIGV